MSSRLYQQAQFLFAVIVMLGAVLWSLLFSVFYFAVPKISLFWQSLFGTLDSACGCDVRAITAYPWVSLILLVVITLLGLYFTALFFSFSTLLWRSNRFVSHQRSSGTQQVPTAFCYGYFRPKIFLSDSLSNILQAKEMRAVVSHEYFHTVHREPLKLLLVSLVRKMYFFLPSVRNLCHSYEQLVEVAADQAAVEAVSSKSIVASALYKMLDVSEPVSPVGAVSFFSSIMEARIASLDDLPFSVWKKISWWKIVINAVVISGLFFLWQISWHHVAIASYEASLCPAEDIVKECREVIKPVCTMSYGQQSTVCLP